MLFFVMQPQIDKQYTFSKLARLEEIALGVIIDVLLFSSWFSLERK